MMLIFLALSVLLHLSAAALVSLLPSIEREKQTTPIPVEVVDLPHPKPEKKPLVVAEVPPAIKENISPEKKRPTVYADREQSVKKETYPRGTPAPMVKSPQPVPPSREAPRGIERPLKAVEGPVAKKSEETSPQPLKPVEEVVRTAPRAEGKTMDEARPRPTPVTPARPRVFSEQNRPNLYPTDERLAELTKNYEAQSPSGEVGKTLQLNTAELKYQKYILDMKRKIELYWDYPDLAARNGWQGSLWITFRIMKDGTVSDVKLERSSGYPMLDDAAVTAIRIAAPFPPFPANFSVEEINIKGQFMYNIIGPAGRQN